MKIALVGPELEENLGLRYIHSSLTQAGHEARLFEFHAPEQIDGVVRLIAEYGADVVGMSMVFTARAREYVELAEKLRVSGYRGHITAGGHFASFHANDLLRDFAAFDSVVHGEGELTLVDLVDNLSDMGAVRGISFRAAGGEIMRTAPRPNPDDLDTLPWPTRSPPFHSYLGKPIANILGSRGCYGHCSFCSIAAWYRQNSGKRFRQRSVACVVDEMSALYHEHGVRVFNFHDDNFFVPDREANLQRFDELRRRIRRAEMTEIAIQVKARPDSIDREIVSLLKESGLFRVFLGVENYSKAGLRTLGKGTTPGQNMSAIAILKELSIHTTFNLLMFDPDSTFEDLRENIKCIRRFADCPINFGRVEIHSGIPLEKRLRDEGRLLGDYFSYCYEIADPRVQNAFEIFHEVFAGRNFEMCGTNYLAMRLDYLFHLYRHFTPSQAAGMLCRRTRQLLSMLNANSADLLSAICDFAEREGRGRRKFTESLLAQRRAYDEKAVTEFAVTIREIEGLAQRRRRKRTNVSRALPAVPAAADTDISERQSIVNFIECCEMAHYPISLKKG